MTDHDETSCDYDHTVPHDLRPDCGHAEDVGLDLPEAEPGIDLPPEEFERILEQARMAPSMGYAMTARRTLDDLETEGRRAFAELEAIARALEAIDTAAAAGAMRRRLDTSGAVLGELTVLAREAEHERRRLDEYDQRLGDAHAVIRGLDQQLGQARLELDEPRLGAARTFELLVELEARVRPHAELRVPDDHVEHPGHPERPIREAATVLLNSLGRFAVVASADSRVTDYRTVDA